MLFGILLIHSVCSSKLDPAVKLLLKVSYDKPEKGIGISFSHFLKQKLDCVPNCSFAVITWVFSAWRSCLLISGVSGFSEFFIIDHIQKSGNHRKLLSVIFQRGEYFSCYDKTFLIILSF